MKIKKIKLNYIRKAWARGVISRMKNNTEEQKKNNEMQRIPPSII